MGCASDKQKTTSESQALIPKMGGQERSVVTRLMELGMSQGDALRYVLEQGAQPVGMAALGGADRALLDEAFSGAETGLRYHADLLAQDLAGTRGLNRSDTPVSGAVLREMLPQLASLQAAKAGHSLGLGLNLAQLNQDRLRTLLGGVSTLPTGLIGLADRFQAERFAGAKRFGTNTTTYTPSLMDSVGHGIGLTSSLLDLGSKFGAIGAAGMSSLSPTAPTTSIGGGFAGGSPLTQFNSGGFPFLVNTPR